VTGSADPADACPLPLTPDGVTAEWLSAALRTRYPGVTVTAADRLEVIEGTATKLLVALRYDGDADGLPERMWIKGGFGEHREFTGNLGVYRSEVLFFTDIAPATGCTIRGATSPSRRTSRCRASSRSRIFAPVT